MQAARTPPHRAPDGGTPPAIAAFPYADRVGVAAPGAPFHWLALGWRDLKAAPVVSIAYGAIFVVVGLALSAGLYAIGALYLLTPLIAGFLIVAPALAVGVYEISRRLEAGERVTFLGALGGVRRNAFHIMTAGLVLMLFLMIWVRLAALIFALFFPYQSMSLAATWEALLTVEGLTFLAVGTAVGGVLAAIAFVCSVVSLPLLLDHKVDIFTAALVSALVVAANLRVMVLWAALLVGLTAFGLALGYVGIAVVLPVLGHATWHAYRALVRWPG